MQEKNLKNWREKKAPDHDYDYISDPDKMFQLKFQPSCRCHKKMKMFYKMAP